MVELAIVSRVPQHGGPFSFLWRRPMWVLREPLYIGGYTVPKGTRSNGASIPPPFSWFYHPGGDWFEAAIMHDWLCGEFTDSPKVTWRAATKAFKGQLIRYGVPRWRAAIFAGAVAVNGWVKGK